MDVFSSIEEEYITGSAGYRELAEKYKVSFSALSKYARDNQWCAKRKSHIADIEDSIKRQQRMGDLTNRLIEKLERAIDELDEYVTTTKTKEKVIEYDDEGKKPVRETVVDTEKVHVEKGSIDRRALKELVGVLLDLKNKDAPGEEEGNDTEIVVEKESREFAV